MFQRCRVSTIASKLLASGKAYVLFNEQDGIITNTAMTASNSAEDKLEHAKRLVPKINLSKPGSMNTKLITLQAGKCVSKENSLSL